jgi:O-antigen ligase
MLRTAEHERQATTMQSVIGRSEAPLSSWALSWVLLVPLIIIASNGLLLFHPADANETLTAQFGALGGGGASTVTNIASTVVLSLIITAVSLPWLKSVVILFHRHPVFVALAVWPFVSCIWSQSRATSLEWSVVAGIEILFIFYIYRRFSPLRQQELLLLLGWVCLLSSIVVSLCFPQYGIDHGEAVGAWRGIYAQKNMCSMSTVMLLPAALFGPVTAASSKVWRVVYVCLSGVLILMTHSATGLVTLACLLAYCGVTTVVTRFQLEDRVIVLTIGGAVALAVAGVFLAEEREILLLLGKDPTLTGRTEIWQAVMPAIMKHPILGYGYRAFWRGYQGDSANVSLSAHWAVTSAHNGLLEVWLDLGVVGVALVAYSFLQAGRDAFVCLWRGRSPQLGWYSSIIVVTVIISADEGALVGPNSLVWLLYILACIGLSEAAKNIHQGVDHG